MMTKTITSEPIMTAYGLRHMRETGMTHKQKANLYATDSYYRYGNKAHIYPAIIQLESTNHCNYKCKMCPNSRFSDRTSCMSVNLFKEIVDQVKQYCLKMRLSFLGEPLLNNDILQMINYAKGQSSAKISLATNGSLLSGELAIGIARSGLDELVISIDADSPQTYKALKGVDLFNEVSDNIRNFLSLSRGNMNVYVKFTQTKDNVQETNAFKDKWSNYNCKPRVTTLNTWAGQLDATDSMRLESYYFSEREPCADLWYKAVVNVSGNLIQCCEDCFGSNIIGDTSKESISDIWNSSQLQTLRESHLAHEYQVSICGQCKESSSELNIKEGLSALTVFDSGRP